MSIEAKGMSIEKKIGFIGNGNMASAIYKGMLSSGLAKPENIIVSALDPNKLLRRNPTGKWWKRAILFFLPLNRSIWEMSWLILDLL